MAGNNNKAFLAILTLTALLSCAPEYTIPSGETPELPEGAVLWLDLTRLNGASTKDTTEMKRMWDALHVSATLQGVVNRGAPLLYLDYVNAEGVNTDEYWWDKYSAPGQWLDGRQRVTVYDGQGVQVLTRQVSGNATEIELVGCPSGMYYITVFTPAGTVCRKLVVE